MTKKKPNSNGQSTQLSNYFWSDDYSPEFTPDSKKMYSLHKVPEINKGIIGV